AWAVWLVGPAVAASVEGHDSAVPSEIGDLPLPLPRVNDRPRRHQQYRRLAAAVHLERDANTVAIDVTLLFRVQGSHACLTCVGRDVEARSSAIRIRSPMRRRLERIGNR